MDRKDVRLVSPTVDSVANLAKARLCPPVAAAIPNCVILID